MMKNFLLLGLFAPISLLGQSLNGVESVEYDPVNGQYLASRGGSSIVAIAPDETLSYFGSGLNADYGMEVMGNTIYCVTGSTIKGYDLTTEMEVVDVTIPGASFLNGLANNGNGLLWVTDFGNGRIIEVDVSNMSSPTTNVIVSNTGCTPNGVVYDEANFRLLFVCWGGGAAIKEVDLSNNMVSNVVANTGVGNIDGIDQDGLGNYYISHWSPAGITKYTNDFAISSNVSVPGISQPADICYAIPTDTLAIPGGNQVIFVGFDNSVGIESIDQETGFSIYPNPANETTSITYQLERKEKVQLDILDTSGRLVVNLISGEQSQGDHRVLFTGLDIENGTYVCSLNKGGVITSSTFIYQK